MKISKQPKHHKTIAKIYSILCFSIVIAIRQAI